MSVTLSNLTFDCVNAVELAGFWSRVLKQPVDPGANEFFATVGRGDDAAGHPTWMFIKVPEPKSTKNRVHVDLTADDWTGEVARVVALGATHLADHDEYGVRWATLADPEGNEFDIAAAA